MSSGGDRENKPVIWLIDGRAEVLEQMESILGGDYQVERFEDARRIVLVARKYMPDLVVLGLAENRISADELLSRGKEFEAWKRVPVLVIFSDEDEVEVEAALEAGASDALSLLSLNEELHRRVRWALQSRARKRKDRDLRMLDFLSRVIEASPNAIVAARRSGEILLFNPAAERILGWSRVEALQMHVRNLYPPGGAERIMGLIRSDEFGSYGRVDSLREVVVSTDGELIPVEISAALVVDQKEEIATVGIFTDLRHQMQMEERLQQAIDVLEQTQRQAVIAEVAGAAAHKLNQPLTSLLGYAEWLRHQVDSEDELYRAIEIVHKDAIAVAEIVRKIGRITRYRTQEYAGGGHIVDLDASSSDSSSDLIASLETDRDRHSVSTEGE